MRISRSTLIGTAVAVALFGGSAFAQQTGASQSDSSKADADNAQTLQEVVVTGIRYSIKKSLAAKRAATNITEVATAEDIGKLPDKNVADVLQRLPGVDTQSAASGEGGFDENNRVSIRGTPASLTQTTIDGHDVATGDWFLLDQFQTVGRSVSYDLLPSEMVSSTVVTKSQSAEMLEGGVSGSVDIKTPRPLAYKPGVTGSLTGGAVYSDLPSKVDPQANVLLSWNNGSFGMLAMGLYEKRDVRRDGEEVLGYSAPPTGGVPHATAAAWQAANPSLPDATGATFPTLIGQALFEQTRKREGGLIDIQAKPSDALSLDLSAFYSHMDADNFNDNFMLWGSNLFGSPTYVPSSLTIQNGTIVAAAFPTQAGAPSPAVYDQISRPGAASETSFINLDATLNATDDLTLDGQFGFTYGLGKTPTEPAYEAAGGNGASYQMNGLDSLVAVTFPGLNTASPSQFSTSWAWNDIEHTIDKETYGKLDATLKLDNGVFEDVKVGARFAHHEREVAFPEDDGCTSYCWSHMPSYAGGLYPSNYQSMITSNSPWAGNIFMYSQDAIASYAALANSTGPTRYYWQGAFDVRENDASAYVMADVGGDHWSGNFGLRLANTLEEVLTNVSGGTNPITFSAFGNFTPTEIDNRYFNVLPSVNFKFDLAKNLILHASAAETMARPDYSALGGSVSLTDLNQTGNGGNPNLKPVRGAVYSTDVEYYYGPESMIEGGLYYMDLASYVDFGNTTASYYNMTFKQVTPYTITSPFNTTAEIKGAELSWTQALPLGFGINTNFTLSNGSSGDGAPVVGDSRYTYNIGGYFQRGPISANLDYSYRSHYLVGLDRSSLENEADWRNLDAAVTYTMGSHFSLNFNALNLTNETIKYYAANLSQPRSFYTNGRQFYFTASYKF